jgi:hypothetical protein
VSEQPRRRVSDVVTSEGEGIYTKIGELIGVEVEITDVKEIQTQFGDSLLVQYLDPFTKEPAYTITSGVVLARKLAEVKAAGALPIIGLITKPGKYYDIA